MIITIFSDGAKCPEDERGGKRNVGEFILGGACYLPYPDRTI